MCEFLHLNLEVYRVSSPRIRYSLKDVLIP
jgi:hypothetical protein